MNGGPTANFVAGQLVACSENSCEKYDDNDNSWTQIADTRFTRWWHSSAQHEDRILLIGGQDSRGSTEWIPTDGGESQIGPWVVRHGYSHCTIQVSSDLIVVTGGANTFDYVTEYQLTGDSTETVMTSLINGRVHHACGVYREAGGQQVLLVTGGRYSGYLSSTEVAVYSAGSPLVWREVEGGELPSPRSGLRATVVGDVLYITGGRDGDYNHLTSVLSWNQAGETWQEVGDLAQARYFHAAVAVPISVVAC